MTAPKVQTFSKQPLSPNTRGSSFRIQAELVLITRDGLCCFHLAGVIGLLCMDSKAVESGKTSCSGPELDVTRELILSNFTRWRDRVWGFCCDETDCEAKVFESVSSTSKDYLLHAAGLSKGLDLQGLVQKLAIYTLFLDVRVVVVMADLIVQIRARKNCLKCLWWMGLNENV